MRGYLPDADDRMRGDTGYAPLEPLRRGISGLVELNGPGVFQQARAA